MNTGNEYGAQLARGPGLKPR